MSDWYLIVDPEDAPESCGSFYWDPLLSTVPGKNSDTGFAAKDKYKYRNSVD